MKHVYPLILSLVLFSCMQRNGIDEIEMQMSIDSLAQSNPLIDEQSVVSILEQIPSPLEISMMLKESGTQYNRSILNSPDHAMRYHSSFQKAVNLGIYGADLGYANLFGENLEGLRYLSAIKGLANDLNIGQFFNAAAVARLATNSNSLDSLLLMTTQSFNAINHHLQQQNRSNLSVLLLVGGWIEAMEIMCEVASQNKNHRVLTERIGEQKIVLEQLTLLLSFYTSDPAMVDLHRDFEALKAIYDHIEITFTYVESSVKIVDGVAVIIDNSTSTINITDEDAARIRKQIDSIRTKMIN